MEKSTAFGAAMLMLLATGGGAYAQLTSSDLSNVLYGYRICRGDYALCAASICQPTGGNIEVNVSGGGTASFPAAVCTCPVYHGPAIADLNGGNMQGSCDPPGKDQVWSLYYPKSYIPQEINQWSRNPSESAVSFQLCSSADNVGATFTNCFSFACTLDKRPTNAVKTATCVCPLGENLDGNPVSPATAVLTPAGQCNSSICSQHPVGAPFATANGEPNQCLNSVSSSSTGAAIDLK